MFIATAPPDLAPHIEQVWYSQGTLEVLQERVLPSNATDIVANLGAPMRLVEGAGIETILGTTVTGLMTRPIVLGHPEVHEALGIRLSSLGLRAVLGIPPAAVANLVIPLAEIVSSGRDELLEACLLRQTPAERLQAGVDWLRQRIRTNECQPDALVSWAASQIQLRSGATSIADLQTDSGYGSTRFNQRFRAELGISPKQFARLVRFRETLNALEPTCELAELALRFGYSDQAHMNREFRLFGNTTPTEVLRSRYPSGLTLAVGQS